jgi:transposase
MALSQDLRLRIVDLVASGLSRREAARQFKVGASSAIRFVRQAEQLGHVDVKKPKRRKSKLDPFRSELIEWIDKQPDLTLEELCARLREYRGLRVGSSTLDDWLRLNQITYKKNGSRQRAGRQ